MYSLVNFFVPIIFLVFVYHLAGRRANTGVPFEAGKALFGHVR